LQKTLVEWLNQVDATYRSELRELNELNFARFDAKLDQRSAELRADIHSLNLDAKLDQRTTELRAEIHALKAELIKWMFLFWAGTALAGLLLH
jgi:uncharacterized small protein (DUF1192 family)